MADDRLIGLLVHKITGLAIDSVEWKKVVQKAKYTLQYDKCTSTSEKEVNDRYEGLAEKFSIKGHRELSQALIQQKQKYLNKSKPLGSVNTNQSILKYDLLQLLLALSSSSNQNYDYIPSVREKDDKNTLTWQEVIKDDPLEGDHWQNWPEDSSSEGYISDSDGFEMEENQTVNNNPVPQQQQNSNLNAFNIPDNDTFDFSGKMDIDEREDQDGLNHLVSLQYWNQGFELASEGSMNTNLLQNPCQMSDALGRIFYSEAERRQLKTVTEADITREVLSLLRGYGGILFEYKEGRFILDENYVVQHVSQHALMSLLGEFCLYGNILSELRQKVASKANDTQYGQTSQAFAETIFKSLMDFDGSLSQLELSASFISRDPTQAISILNLRNTLDPSLQCFKAINDIALDIPFAEANPRLITTYLIATLFDRTLIAQSSGQMLIYDTLLYTLEQTLVPYGRIMDDWIYYGLLTGDKAGEFYVSRRDSVSLSDPNFWIDGFSIQPVIHPISTRFPCPLFDDALMARMLFTGKAVNLLSQIEKTRKQLPQPDQTYIPFGTVISRFLAVKPPFIKFTGKITQPLHSSPPAYDLFTSACIPLATEAKTDVEQTATSTYDFGSLFDQNFFRCSEAYIEEPYKKTADKLNNTLHRDCGLSRQLESLAAIYLMLENDLMHSFCEALFIHIDNNEPWFDQRVLNQTFTEACETSGYNEAVYIQVRQRRGDNTSSPTTIAKYLEDIEVKMEIPWPLNNFIQTELLPSYSKILGFLLRLKRAKYVMEKKTLFPDRKKADKSDTRSMRFYSMRMRILWFINAFWRYMMTTILHAETITFRNQLSLSKDADEITALHSSYVRRIVDRCLLNEKASAIKKSIVSILDMAEQMVTIFMQYMQVDSLEDNPMDTNNSNEFHKLMNTMEKEFNRTNQFISISLMILGKKGGFPWLESLATSLSVQC